MSRLSQVLDEGSSTGAALTEIYEGLGIALYDSSGQMRSMYDILGDLAGKWKTLDTNTQQYIALTSAGMNGALLRLIAGNSIDFYLPMCYSDINTGASN